MKRTGEVSTVPFAFISKREIKGERKKERERERDEGRRTVDENVLV